MKPVRYFQTLFLFFFSIFAVQQLWAGPAIELSVVEKDTLIHICRKYLDNPGQWRAVAKANKLKNPHLILPGQKLMIPAEMLKGSPFEGIVTFAKGDVQVMGATDTAWRALKIDQPVYEKSKIKTGPTPSAPAALLP